MLHAPLCPWLLAKHLHVPLYKLSDFAGDRKIDYLMSERGQKEFSAMVCFEAAAAFIIYNDAHSKKRQAANIAHEVAHVVLRHPPKPPINSDGTREFDPIMEAEANWLGPALLVSEEAALHIVAQSVPLGVAADRYGVSEELITMRTNVTGARRRVRRRRVA